MATLVKDPTRTLAGTSTLNRLELTPEVAERDTGHDQEISMNGVANARPSMLAL